MYPPLVGNEFKNQVIDEILEAFNIERSLSMKGCPYDNAVATLTGITIIGSTLHWDIYPQLNIVKIPLKKLFSLVLTIHDLIVERIGYF